MDFFRKLFPIISQKKSMAPDTNGNSLSKRTIHISVNQSPPQPNTAINSNTLKSNVILNNKEDLVTNDDTSGTQRVFNKEKDSNMILSKLENVAPKDINLGSVVCNKNSGEIEVIDNVVHKDTSILNNSTYKTKANTVKYDKNDETLQNCSGLEEIQIMPDEMSKYSGILNNLKYYIEISAMDDESLQNLNKTSMEPKVIGVINDVSSNDARVSNNITNNTEINTFKDVVDDETLQNLREFEETLTACMADDSEDLINLDEFNEIFDNLDTENDDSIPQVSPKGNTLEHNNENTINNNKADAIKENNNNLNEPTNSNMLENVDIISISSREELISQIDLIQDISINSDTNETQNSDDDGYNSSDFEFISETEANMDGFIINFSRENYREKYNLSPSSSEPLSHFSGQRTKYNVQRKNASEPGEDPSGLNRPKNQYEDRSYRNNHRIPEGDDYLGLFQGIYNPILPACEIYFLENKSVRTSAMNVQYDGIGFDKQLALRRPQPDSSEEEFEDEAKECAKKILNMYPGENRKRRRRY